MREGLADANPVIGTNKAAANGSRDRVLTDDELRSIWNALAQLITATSCDYLP